MSDYTDEELRMKVIPLAVELVNSEVQRVLGKCNTSAIADITSELVNIIKYGTVNAPDLSGTAISEAKYEDVQPKKAKKSSVPTFG